MTLFASCSHRLNTMDDLGEEKEKSVVEEKKNKKIKKKKKIKNKKRRKKTTPFLIHIYLRLILAKLLPASLGIFAQE